MDNGIQIFVYDDSLHFFQLFLSYFYMLKWENPGTVNKLKIDDEIRFEYLFLVLDPCISNFVSYNRLVIMINKTHLKGKYMGVMFVARIMDVNKQIYPLAFGFGDGENDQSWTWLLIELCNVIGPSKLDDYFKLSYKH